MLRTIPRTLVAASLLFFAVAYFPVSFRDAPVGALPSYLTTVLTALPSLVALWGYLGGRRAAVALLALAAFAFAIESTGTATGFPYGEFYYGEALGPKLFGLSPYILPVSYVPLVVGAVAAAYPTVKDWPDSAFARRFPWILGSTLLLVLMDGVLDPSAAALGFWVWPGGGLYYGVPVSNYLGWLLSGLLAASLLIRLGRWSASPPPGLLDSAIIAMAFWAGVACFSGLFLPALLGVALYLFLLRRRVRLRSHSGLQRS